MANTPVLVQSVHDARTEWEYELRHGEAAELYIVVTVSIVGSLGVLGEVDAGGQEGRVDEDAATYMLFVHSFGGSGGPGHQQH